MANDVHFLSVNRPGMRMGMGHYERLLLRHLALETALRIGMTFAGRRRGDVAPTSVEGVPSDHDYLGFSTTRLTKLPWPLARQLVRGRLARIAPALFHSLALDFPPPPGPPAVVTIHDVPPARFPDEGTLPRWASRVANTADLIIAPSEFAKREIVDVLSAQPERVVVIPYGCEHDRFHPDVPPASASALERLGIRRPFLIYAGGTTRRKNVAALLDAWRSLHDDHPDHSLVLVGPGLEGLLQRHPAPRVIAPGYMDREVLPSIMRAAEALVFPSIYEGFGMPPQEAMALGVPVVAVRTGGAIPEVVGDCAVLAESGDADAIADAIDRLLSDLTLQEQLRVSGPRRARTFSWAEHARAVAEAYESLNPAVSSGAR